ncbi:SapC family protein [Belnapia sp. T6]|uniref:SapC family protein n=1 Tax=Belnapia mucosa TaxID=2804532 RepID=A0ABS1V174_9PROT|nr:SapC family protein [Belnapia mucosa]MBL6455454.1 SapC family protein [Belnapia mucosa]
MSEIAVSHGVVNGAAQSAPSLPPLYRALEGLTAERHAALRLHDAGYGFAAGASAIPLAAEEFTVAARSLPIVFAATAPHMPVVITGLSAGTNLYVDAGGAWKAGAYVPAYLRRFPFFLLRVAPDSEELALCIDPSAPQVSETTGEPLFAEDGKPAPQLERAFAFTKSVEEAMLRTRTMTLRLAELGLLKSSVVQFEHHGKPLRVDGFFAVDRPALAALAPEQLAELRDRGWLEVIYAHLLSIGGMPELARSIQG